MPFHILPQRPLTPTRWEEVTHLRLTGKKPETNLALARWKVLKTLADGDGVVPMHKALAILDPVRNLDSGREASIRSDLRNWSNPVDHGNNSQDKGWLELGCLTSS
jgi:hypothetical protein